MFIICVLGCFSKILGDMDNQNFYRIKDFIGRNKEDKISVLFFFQHNASNASAA